MAFISPLTPLVVHQTRKTAIAVTAPYFVRIRSQVSTVVPFTTIYFRPIDAPRLPGIGPRAPTRTRRRRRGKRR